MKRKKKETLIKIYIHKQNAMLILIRFFLDLLSLSLEKKHFIILHEKFEKEKKLDLLYNPK